MKDKWPTAYQTTPWTDQDPTPIRSQYDILSFTRSTLNGLNHMQVFAANSILQRKLSPEAEIIMMNLPMEVPPTKISFKDTAVMTMTGFLTFISLMPLVLYFAAAMAKAREDVVKQTLV